jgi:diguanylate cyclase (GGDEF)-like protein
MEPVLEEMVAGYADPAAVVDVGGHLLRANPSLASLLGVRPREVRQWCDARRKLGTLIHLRPSVRAVTGSLPAITVDADGRPPADEFDAMLGQAVRTHRAVNLAEVPCRLGDDGEAVLWLSLLPLRAADGQVHVLVTMRDVSTEARVHGRYRELLAEALARAENLERAVEERTRELRAALDEVTRLARTDVLTGLANRRAFTESAEQQLKIAHRHQRSMAVAIVDLDHFKTVNDTCGHAAGDELLRIVGRVMSSTVRTTDQVGRLGGEEFGLLFEEVDRDGAWLAADRLRLAIAEVPVGHVVRGREHQTASIGVATFPDDGTTLDQLIARADDALYAAKHAGRNRVALTSPART